MWRSIENTYKLIKTTDPDSAITKHYLRELAKTGKIATLTAGTKILINFVSLKQYLSI